MEEWNLLSAQESNSLAAAVEALRSRLDRRNPAIAIREFRSLLQAENESVLDFARRLKSGYRKAHGTEFTREIRDFLLFYQLQDGLLETVAQSPQVGVASTYQQLLDAAITEERRLLLIHARRQGRAGTSRNESAAIRPTAPVALVSTSSVPVSSSLATTGSSSSQSAPRSFYRITCYNCSRKGTSVAIARF